jgi:phosphatidylinositol-3-phosphatase
MKRFASLMAALVAGNMCAQAQIAIQSLPDIKTVFVIALENHDLTQPCPDCGPQQLLGNPAAPYLNSLITPGNPNSAQVSYATAYYSAAQGLHPSEPNYIWSEAGTEFGAFTDNDPSTNCGNLFTTTNHLCGQLTAQGIVWKSYQEDLQYTSGADVSRAGTLPSGTNIYNGSKEFYYAVKHNPAEFFTDTQNQNVYPLEQLWADLTNNAAGRYNWITPDQFNEMHSYLPGGFTYNGTLFTGNQAAIAQGDNCLSILIPQIMASAAYQDHGAIIIWTDETESTDDTRTTLPEIIISPMAKGNAYASTVPVTHSSDLKTMDEIFGLTFQTADVGGTNDLSDMFLIAKNPPASPSVIMHSKKMANEGGFQLMFSGTVGQSYQVLVTSDLALPKSAWTVAGSGIFETTNAVFVDHSAGNYPGRYYAIASQ